MTLAGPRPDLARGNPSPHRRELKLGSHGRCPGLVMSLGAGVMERRAAVREVSRRLPFLQAVGADVSVGHSDSGK
eukprot:1716050-Rhodomonas_salina.1